MKQVLVSLMGILMLSLMSCDKDQVFLPQEEAMTTEFRSDSPIQPIRPAWAFTINEMENCIRDAVEKDLLFGKVGTILLIQLEDIEERIIEDAIPSAKKKIKIFKGTVVEMVEDGHFQAGSAKPLLKMTEDLTYILDGKLVQFREGFENYPLGTFPYDGKWSMQMHGMGEGFQGVSDEQAVSGKKSLKLEGQLGYPTIAVRPVEQIREIVFVEANINIQKATKGSPYLYKAGFGLSNPTIPIYGTHFAFVAFEPDGFIYFTAKDIKTDKIQPWHVDRWYKIRIKFNNRSKRADLWIDGELVLENVDLKGPKGTYSAVVLNSGLDSHTFTYFDEVMLWNPVE